MTISVSKVKSTANRNGKVFISVIKENFLERASCSSKDICYYV